MSHDELLFVVMLLTITLPSVASVHIIHVLADDLGWAELGFNRALNDTDTRTPYIDQLSKESLIMNRFYVDKICSPSRCAIQTGRAPVHVNVQNVVPEVHNSKDQEGGYQGIPVSMTGMAEHMTAAGWETHLVGKWDAGMATPRHSPRGRGYKNWLGYWHHANDYWSFNEESCHMKPVKDLWRANGTLEGPARDLQNCKTCSQANQSPGDGRCQYEEALLGDEVRSIIRDHNQSTPLFLFWAMHLVHMPLQVPAAYLAKFAHIDDKYRRSMHAMVNYMDDELAQVVDLLKSTGMWENTLFVFHSDNGGEIMAAGICGGNNWPLRGGKFSNWEGGIRVAGLVSGGVLPPQRRGQREEALVTGWDWYSTYVQGVAGRDPTDHRAAAAGLPAIDSVDMWPLLTGTNSTGPRSEVIIGDTSAMTFNGDGNTLVGGLIVRDDTGLWKLLLGAKDKLYLIDQDVRTGPKWPNSSSHLVPLAHARTCGRNPRKGCLFNLDKDPYEMDSLASVEETRFQRMLARVDELQKGVYSPDRGKKDTAACTAATSKYQGYWGPWLPDPYA